MSRAFLALLSVFLTPALVFGAANLSLEHPDKDIKRIFSDSTRYRVRDLMLSRHADESTAKLISGELAQVTGSATVAKDTAFTFYLVYQNADFIGVILGTTLALTDGPAQIFVAYEKSGKMHDVYVQKIRASDRTAFRSKYYRRQYRKFSIHNRPEVAYVKPPVRLPSKSTIEDHHRFVRAVAFNALVVKTFYNAFNE